MRPFAICLAALSWGAAAHAEARPLDYAEPVVVETRSYSALPRAVGRTPDVDVGHLLVGAEAPANVDVYALTEDEAADVPVVRIERRIAYRTVRAWRPAPLRVRG